MRSRASHGRPTRRHDQRLAEHKAGKCRGPGVWAGDYPEGHWERRGCQWCRRDVARERGDRPRPPKRQGPGHPPLGGAGAGVTPVTTVRLTEAHQAELERLVADGHGPRRSDAIRHLIDESAGNRKEAHNGTSSVR